MLLDGPGRARAGRPSLDVPVPASGVAYIRVGLTLDAAAPANAASTVSLPAAPGGTRRRRGADTTRARGAGAARSGDHGPLPTTGADAAALAAAALALVALGLTLRTWGASVGGARATGWTP